MVLPHSFLGQGTRSGSSTAWRPAISGMGLVQSHQVSHAWAGSMGSLPATLREMGILEKDLEEILEAAMRDHSTPSNPRAMAVEGCRQVLEAVF